ncbi:MAG: ATP-binding cassette domain-containing protein [Nitriliruptorales bacterium]|nr:ATP-binding cassette domain-containing protein [Nitriliruptorales bacterium]
MSGVRVDGLTVEFRDGPHVVRPLDEFSFAAEPGQLAIVLGPSGSGKTTLLSCVAGILAPTAGAIQVDGVRVDRLDGEALDEYRRRHVGVVYQAFNLVPSLTAVENVAMQLLAAGVSRSDAMSEATRQLEAMGLGHRLRHRPGSMSGGEQQRVSIARAVVHGPGLVLADEPTAHLDYAAAEVVLRALRTLADDGRTVVVSTHDSRLLPIADTSIELVPRAEPIERRQEELDLAKGELLFAEGDPSDVIYRLVSGELELFRTNGAGEEILRVCGAGDYFGELGPLLGFPRSASARARTDVTIEALGVVEFRALTGRTGTSADATN